MKSGSLLKFLTVLFCSFFQINSAVAQASAQTEVYASSSNKTIRSYYSDSYACFTQRESFFPELTTYTSAHPEMMTEANIQHCVQMLKKQSWKPVKQNPSARISVDVLRDARTMTMTCMHISISSMPTFYQVVFPNLSLTGKGKELVDCLSYAAQSPNRVATPSNNL